MKQETLDRALAARAQKRPVAMVTDLQGGLQALVFADDSSGELELDEATVSAARRALRDDASGVIEGPDGPLFINVLNPPLKLVIVGAVHIAQALAPMASLAGYAVTVVDPRGAFATEARFPGVALVDEWPDDALNQLGIDSRTAVVTLTHDPKLDDPALTVALRSDAFYIGALGSKKTHGARLERLRHEGWGDEDFARIRAPVGLAIGAKSPAEIAVAIMAEVTAALRQAAT